MPIAPFTEQSWLFVPPLDLPLELRLENGRFGALRPKPLPGPPPCATGQIIPADDPRNPTGADVHFANQIHEAVDLAAAAGDCVFAAYSGRVVEVEANPAGTRGNVTIDHHPRGLGFVTKYNHVTDIAVAQGEFVQKGTPFAAVSAHPPSRTFTSSCGRWSTARRPPRRGGRGERPRPARPDAGALRLGAAHNGRRGAGRPAARATVGRTRADPHRAFFTATFDAETATVLHVPSTSR